MGIRALRVAGIRPADLFPREHGLWAWIGVPLVAAIGLAATPSVIFGALTIVVGTGASSAWRNRAPALALMAAVVSVGLGVASLMSCPQPTPLAVGALILGGVAVSSTWWLGRRQPPGQVRHAAEAALILVVAAAAGGLAVLAGADPQRVALVQLALATWQITSLWRINRDLSRVLKREPWYSGPVLAMICVAATAYTAITFGQPILVGLFVLYGVRVSWHAPMTHARDAKRVGLAELFWTLVATVWVLTIPF